MKINLKLAIALSTFLSFILLTGCNTVKGFGQDLQQGGQHLEKAADDKNDK